MSRASAAAHETSQFSMGCYKMTARARSCSSVCLTQCSNGQPYQLMVSPCVKASVCKTGVCVGSAGMGVGAWCVCVFVCVSMGGCLMSSNVFILCSPSILAMLWNVTDRPRTFSMTGWGGGRRGKVPPCLPLLCYECVQATGDEWICSCCLWQPCMVTMR